MDAAQDKKHKTKEQYVRFYASGEKV